MSKFLFDSSSRKLEQGLQQITTLLAGDFPHRSSKDALKELERFFQRRFEQLEDLRALAGNSEDVSVQNFAMQVNLDLNEYTPVMGFLLRSTNVRNSFEFFDPLARLAKQLIGKDARLILSSEWDFSPMTYPMCFQQLPNYVFVGLPTTESENPLVIPLAGHEFGHSVWQNNRVEAHLNDLATEQIGAVILKHTAEYKLLRPSVDPAEFGSDMFSYNDLSVCRALVLSRLEEMFCDIIGAGLFGTGFLYSFKYLIAPSVGDKRSELYPATITRAATLQDCAKRFNFDLPANFLEDFDPNERIHEAFGQELFGFLSDCADEAVTGLTENLFQVASGILAAAGIKPPDRREIEAVERALAAGIPINSYYSLPCIIGAGWRVLLKIDDENKEEQDFLSEIVFKSIEVSEYCFRIDQS